MSKRIMAKLKGSVASYRMLFDEDNLPDLGLELPVGLDRARPYSPLEEIEDGFELYYVVLDNEQKEKMVDPYIEASGFGADRATQAEYNAINAIYKISGRKIIFSRVSSSARIGENGRTLLSFGEKDIAVSKLSFAIDFSGDVDAYYDGMDRIYFSKFSKAKPLFRGFDEFYQEALYDDKESFLDNDLFAVSDLEPEDIGVSDTNKIIEIQNNHKLDLEKEEMVRKVQNYANKYPLSGVVLNKEGRILITNKEDLKLTVKLLAQRYYTSEVTGEMLEARGSERMKDQKTKKAFGEPKAS